MTIRDTLLTRLTLNLNSYSQFKVSTELPFVAGNVPLHVKNMKTVYVDEDQIEVTEFIPTLDNRTINQTVTTVVAYLAVDAKNKPANTDAAIAAMQAAVSAVAPVVNVQSTVSTEIQEDIIIYSVEYRFLTI
jgi:hypothetical protein